MKTILCFGDSNTWGADPSGYGRYGIDVRWPRVMAKMLGEEYWIVEEGLPGRTTVWDDPVEPHRKGSDYLPASLMSHQPLDLVVIMLGTNDVKYRLSATAVDIAAGMGVLADIVHKSGAGPEGSAPKVLLVAPTPISDPPREDVKEILLGGVKKSRQLAGRLKAVADEMDCAFFDAGTVIKVSPVDGVHLEAEAQIKLGEALAAVCEGLLK
jgi:lysophospholipase L1-like esterase